MSKQALYGKFAKYYDKIYSWKDTEQEVDFIGQLARKHKLGRDVLDVACGTGRHALLLKQRGYNITGVDINEDMLEIAKKKVKGVEFINADMKTLRLGKRFDIILCMFTTMSYNRTLDELKNTLKNFYDMLDSPGMVVFDMGFVRDIFRQGHMGIDVVDEDGIKLVRLRQTRSMGDQADFNMVFFTKKNGKVDFDIDTHKLGIFSLKDIKRVMKSVGFRVSVLQGFTKKRFKNENPVFVGVR